MSPDDQQPQTPQEPQMPQTPQAPVQVPQQASEQPFQPMQPPTAQPTVPPAVYAPNPAMPNQNKSKTGLIVGIVIAVVLFLVIGGIAAFALISSASKSSTESSGSSSSKSSDSKGAIKASTAVTAKYVSDYDAVCTGGSVANAAAFTKPYVVAAFYNDDAKSDYWTDMSVGYGKSYYADSDSVAKVNVVACLPVKTATQTKAKTCDFKGDNGGTVPIDYYSADYDMTYYEAKTGKKIKDGSAISGPASSCPFVASYSKDDPKIIANPDKNTVEAALDAFAK